MAWRNGHFWWTVPDEYIKAGTILQEYVRKEEGIYAFETTRTEEES